MPQVPPPHESNRVIEIVGPLDGHDRRCHDFRDAGFGIKPEGHFPGHILLGDNPDGAPAIINDHRAGRGLGLHALDQFLECRVRPETNRRIAQTVRDKTAEYVGLCAHQLILIIHRLMSPGGQTTQ
jgi:hypothetical protein